jgi:hypothetical protein
MADHLKAESSEFVTLLCQGVRLVPSSRGSCRGRSAIVDAALSFAQDSAGGSDPREAIAQIPHQASRSRTAEFTSPPSA